jgi:N4-gp56 family major capsid protein
MPGTYNANASVELLSDVLVTATDAKGKLYAKKLEAGAAAYDDFKAFEGAEGSDAIFWIKRDLAKTGGDKMVFTVQSDLAGPGVRGEEELTGKTSTAKYSNYELQLDFFRDAHEITKKEKRFMAAGADLDQVCIDKLKVKLGRQRMYDMKMWLIRYAVGNILRPNGRKTRDEITAADTMSPSFLVTSKPQVQRLGAQPLALGRNKDGSPVYRYMAYMPDVMMTEIRNDTAYQGALQQAVERSQMNPLFTGKLVDWNNMGLFEHILMSQDADDHIADPTAPLAILGTAFSVDSAVGACKLIVNSANTRHRYFEWFPGYDYLFYEGQTAAADSDTYYAWIVNTDGSVGFVSYVGSSNNGNQITLAAILSPDGAGTSTLGVTTLGNIDASSDTWDSTPGPGDGGGTSNTSADFNYTDSFGADAYIIPANANGACIGRGFLFGKGAALRGYGSTDTMITQKRDYEFVHGRGYESVYGQQNRRRTDGKTFGYGLFEVAITHPGLEVPSL